MEVREIKNKDVWERFLSRCENKTFLQSWNWGIFQQKMGCRIWRLGIYEKQALLSVSLVIQINARRGRFLFLPHGPVISPSFLEKRAGILGELLKDLKLKGKKAKARFLRIAPIWERTEDNKNIFSALGFMDAPMHTHPEVTWELDLNSSEEELLMNMRKSTRYEIRRALKNRDLTVEKLADPRAVDTFNKVYQETVRRHNFVPFSLKYLRTEMEVFSREGQILVMNSLYRGKVVSSAIIVFWQGIGFYHHGASLTEYGKIPASHLLQWEAIREAKKRHCRKYNFWGITESQTRSHPFWGLSLFKRGFGGYKKQYLRTQDLPLSPLYFLTRFFEIIRKKKRGF